MPSIAGVVAEYLKTHPELTCAEKQKVLAEVPPHQWALPGGYFDELSEHCNNRKVIHREPRFMNRLAIYTFAPAPRCLYRSPDGRGLAWLKSGGSVLAYEPCEQEHCFHAQPKE